MVINREAGRGLYKPFVEVESEKLIS